MSPAKRETTLSQEEFEELLDWLSPDRALAGEKYEHIRTNLIQIFTNRRCQSPEDLADETIDRVAKKVHGLSGTYVGAPELYFYGVAKRVFLEYLRRPVVTPIPPATDLPSSPTLADLSESDEYEHIHECLETCLAGLDKSNHELLLSYYANYRLSRAKSEKRKNLAVRQNLKAGALRARVHRLRQKLEKCINDCLKRAERPKAE